MTLEMVLKFKYLGVLINSTPYNMFTSFDGQVRNKAMRYLGSVFNLTRDGPNRSYLAFILWSKVALPSILYGVEIIPITQGTLTLIERCQMRVGKFILQVDESSANVGMWIPDPNQYGLWLQRE